MNNTNSLNKWLWLVHKFSFLQFIADYHLLNKLVSWHFNLKRINCLGRNFPPILYTVSEFILFRLLTPRSQLPFVIIVQLKPSNKLLPWIVLRLSALKAWELHCFHCALLAGWSGRVSKYDQRCEGEGSSTTFFDSKPWNLRTSFLDLEKGMKT